MHTLLGEALSKVLCATHPASYTLCVQQSPLCAPPPLSLFHLWIHPEHVRKDVATETASESQYL